jgi:hypothetical protein
MQAALQQLCLEIEQPSASQTTNPSKFDERTLHSPSSSPAKIFGALVDAMAQYRHEQLGPYYN